MSVSTIRPGSCSSWRHAVEIALVVQALAARQRQREQRQRHQLGGEGLGGRHADLGAGARHQHQRRFAHDRRLGHVAHGHLRQVRHLLGQLERGQRVGGFARLGDGEEQRAFAHHRVAVAVFAGDLGRAGHAGQLFDPVTRHQAGVVAGAAGDDVHGLGVGQQALGVDAEDLGEDLAAGDAAFQRVGHGLGLLVDFLEHVVGVVAALHGVGVELRLLHFARDRLAVGVEDLHAGGVQARHVAFLQVQEAAGQRQQRVDVGAEVLLALAQAHHQRRAQARADQHARLARRHHHDGVGAVQAAHDVLHRGQQRQAARAARARPGARSLRCRSAS